MDDQQETSAVAPQVQPESLPLGGDQIDPTTLGVLRLALQMVYTTTLPVDVPTFNMERVYFDGVSYWYYVYAHGGWRSVKLGTSSGIGGKLNGTGATNVFTANAPTKVTLATTDFSNGVTLDTVNNRITVLTAGYYLIQAQVYYSLPSTGKRYDVEIYVNNTQRARTFANALSTGVTPSVCVLLNLSANDYVELFTEHNSSSGTDQVSGTSSPSLTYLSVALQ